jgi:hypothetical protein
VLPLDNVALIVLVTVLPGATLTLPELARVKSKIVVLENHALASELGLVLLLNAFAFSSASEATSMGPEYFFDDCVGDEPSTV